MSTAANRNQIREARPEEYEQLRFIELEADSVFETVGIGPFDNDDGENHLSSAAMVLVASDPPLGFITLDIVDGLPNIWQLSVLPDEQRRGIGKNLIEAACDWARANNLEATTLTTFRDVPWNGPFYQRLGFSALSDLSPGLEAIREHEREIGDDTFGSRIAMRKELIG